jgi:hypothetical protein
VPPPKLYPAPHFAILLLPEPNFPFPHEQMAT